MAPPRKTRCTRGHELRDDNVRMVKLQSGYTVRQCKQCRALMDSERYRNKPARQAAIRHRAIERYREMTYGPE